MMALRTAALGLCAAVATGMLFVVRGAELDLVRILSTSIAEMQVIVNYLSATQRLQSMSVT